MSTNAVQTISGTATSGQARFAFGAFQTDFIAWNASLATVLAELSALPNIGVGNISATGGPLSTAPIVITFIAALAGQPVLPISVYTNPNPPPFGVQNFTPAGSITVAQTTTGIAAASAANNVIPAPIPIAGSGLGDPIRHAGAPAAAVAATAAVQTITSTATAGQGRLAFNGFQTDFIAWNATLATVLAELLALPTIGPGNITATGGPLSTANIVLTFAGALASAPQNLITVALDQFTATGSVTIATTTTGVTPAPATGAGVAIVGALLADTTNGVLYQNTGTQATPTWTKVGTES